MDKATKLEVKLEANSSKLESVVHGCNPQVQEFPSPKIKNILKQCQNNLNAV